MCNCAPSQLASILHCLCFAQVSNALIKKELGVRLQFPTYREGLSAIAQGDMRPYN